MKANKLFFDIYSTGGSIPYEEYRLFYKQNDTVYICLLDEGIYTKVKRQEMFDTNMHHGCFIEHYCSITADDVRTQALSYIEKYNLMYVTPEEFRRIEAKDPNHRYIKAFAEAEKIIAKN